MSELEGQTVEEVRPMTDEELAENHWAIRHSRPIVFVFEDGTKIYPSADQEGNGPGQMFGEEPSGRMFAIIPKNDET